MRLHSVLRLVFLCGFLLVCQSAPADLLAYYSFDGSNPLHDRSGQNRHLQATETSNVVFEDGIQGTAAVFPGVSVDGGNVTEDDYLTLPMADAPDFGLDHLSVSLWYRRNNPQDDIGATGPEGGPDGIYDSLGGTVSGYQLFLLPDGRINGRFDSEDGGFVVVNTEEASNLEMNDADPTLFGWHHIAYTFDREEGEVKLYKDGSLAEYIYASGDSFDLFDANITPSQDFWIGRANQHGADGQIDDLAFFNQVLTDEEIEELHSLALSPGDFVDSILGDFNADGELDAADVDLLTASFGETGIEFDLDADGTVAPEDQRIWVEDIFGTAFGDADLNRSVEFADFLALSSNFSQSGGWTDGDFDGDGTTGFPDFLLLSTNFGESAQVNAVPEPNASVLVAAGLLLFQLRRKRILEMA